MSVTMSIKTAMSVTATSIVLILVVTMAIIFVKEWPGFKEWVKWKVGK